MYLHHALNQKGCILPHEKTVAGGTAMETDAQELRVQRLIAEAALDPARWTAVCDGVSALCQATGAVIVPVAVSQHGLGLPHSASIGEAVRRYVNEGWNMRDERRRGLAIMRQKKFMIDADCIPYDDMRTSDFYQDFLRPSALQWFLGLHLEAGGSHWVVSIQKDKHSPEFDDGDIARALSIRSHLCSAASIAQQLGFAKLEGAAEAYERQGFCAIGIDSDEKVVFISKSAHHHIGRTLEIRNGKLLTVNPVAEAEIARLVRRVAGNDATRGDSFAVLPGDGIAATLIVHGCRLPEIGEDVFRPAVALLILQEPDRTPRVASDLLARYFELTRSEAQLASMMAQGKNVEDFASAQRISVTTARNHLQNLMRKTNTHRQGELVASLLRVAALAQSQD